MAAKHTPGPKNDPTPQQLEALKRFAKATGRSWKQVLCDARLVIRARNQVHLRAYSRVDNAAPDLLEALKLLKDRWAGGKASANDWKKIEAAIAKAEGTDGR